MTLCGDIITAFKPLIVVNDRKGSLYYRRNIHSILRQQESHHKNTTLWDTKCSSTPWRNCLFFLWIIFLICVAQTKVCLQIHQESRVARSCYATAFLFSPVCYVSHRLPILRGFLLVREPLRDRTGRQHSTWCIPVSAGTYRETLPCQAFGL